jgi:hypothetical protein
MATTDGHRITAGALSGLVATGPMTAAFEAAHRLGLLDELPPERIVRILLPGLSPQWRHAVAAVAHLAYGAGVGAALTAVAPRAPLSSGTRIGAGLIVWALSYEGWVPVAGVLPPAHRDRRPRALTIAAAHVVYGLALRIPRGR